MGRDEMRQRGKKERSEDGRKMWRGEKERLWWRDGGKEGGKVEGEGARGRELLTDTSQGERAQ